MDIYRTLKRLEKIWGRNLIFLKEPFIELNELYNISKKLSKEIYGIELPMKDIRNRVNLRNGPTVSNSKTTLTIIEKIKKRFYFREINSEFDSFIFKIPGEILAVTDDKDIFYGTAIHNRIKTVSFPHFLLGNRGNLCNREDYYYYLFRTFIFGAPKNGVYGAVFIPFIENYEMLSGEIVKKFLEKNPDMGIVNYVWKYLDHWSIKEIWKIKEIISIKRDLIINILRPLNRFEQNEMIKKEVWRLAAEFVKKTSPEIHYLVSNEKYYNYINKTCFNY